LPKESKQPKKTTGKAGEERKVEEQRNICCKGS
jgi:hypothetical protein